jgi:hypothetical protein
VPLPVPDRCWRGAGSCHTGGGTGHRLGRAPGGPKIATATPVNADVSQRHLNESEEAIAVNPANPDNIVTVTNVGHR